MNNLLAGLVICHLCGDFLLQTKEMAAYKNIDTSWCVAHVAWYLVPFGALFWFGGLPPWFFLLIGVQHFFQDRFSWNLWWLRRVNGTDAATWPLGPLCVDQAMHLTFIGIVYGIWQLFV